MKKQLLLSAALIGATLAFSQSAFVKRHNVAPLNMADKIAEKFAVEPTQTSPVAKPAVTKPETPVNDPSTQDQEASSQALPPTAISWKVLCGTANCYGQIVSNSRPLQYNPDLKAISFVHRASNTYTASPAVAPTSTTGTQLVEISLNGGANWDSTAIWANSTNWGRYPQGAIYSALGNTNIANAYIFGSGPCTNAGSVWSGSWYASKKLAVAGSTLYNNIPDAAPNAQQFVSATGTPIAPGTTQHGWPRYGASSTSDGAVRSLGLISNDLNALTSVRGFAVVKGSYTGGVFTWSLDSLIPPCIVTTSTVKVLSSDAQMAWSQDGHTGYVVMLGAAAGASLNNKSYQPIIYKTANSGGSWAPIAGIDFNDPAMAIVPQHIAPINVSNTIAAPYFNNYDIAVDALGKLHIGALIISENTGNNDSLNYISQFTMSINVGDKYLWGHTPGNRPYVYDFIGDGSSPWIVKVIDSLATEDPGAATSSSGYAINPWDNTGPSSQKINCDPRLQMGRTPDGNYITFSWAESDTNFVNAGHKWNVLPDIHTRCLAVGVAPSCTYVVSPTEINVSKPAAGQGTSNSKVSAKAFLHYMSPVLVSETVFTTATTSTIDIVTPITITNSSPLQQLTNNTNWYATAKLSYSFSCMTVGTPESTFNSPLSTNIYPNPTTNNATLFIELKDNSTPVSISVFDFVGREVKNIKAEGQAGENNINCDFGNLASGIYIINIKAGNITSTKKLIIQGK